MTVPELRDCERPCGSIQSDDDGGGYCVKDVGHSGHCSDGDADWHCPIPAAGENDKTTTCLICGGDTTIHDYRCALIEAMRSVVEAAEALSDSDTAAFDDEGDIRLMRVLGVAVDAYREATHG